MAVDSATPVVEIIPETKNVFDSLKSARNIEKTIYYDGWNDAITDKEKQLKEIFKAKRGTKDLLAHSAKVHSVAWNCTGNLLASGSFDKTVCVYSLKEDRLSKNSTHKGHSGSVDQLCWHPNNSNTLSTASGDKTVRIWDNRSHQSCTAVINTKGENINICWSPDGNTIGVGDKEDLVSFIDCRTHKIVSEKSFPYEVNEISWNKTGDLFFLTNGSGSVPVLRYPDLEPYHICKKHPGTCICIDFDPSGRYFAVGSADALVSLWETEEFSCVRIFSRLDWPVRAVSFSCNGTLLASASEDLFIGVSHVESGRTVADITVESATFTLAWHPKQYLLAYACDDKEYYNKKKETGMVRVFGFTQEIIENVTNNSNH